MTYRTIKRVGDVTVSVLALLLLMPVMVVIATLIRWESAGPVIFRQQRLGLNGEVFTMYKFRSMCVDAEKGGVYETAGDPRITRAGKFLRRTSLDELPQFVNIMKGDMSLVGPRPTLLYHPWRYEEYTEEQKKRFLVRPGVTGWAQVNGRKQVEWEERIRYDVTYAADVSFLFDIRIILLTVLHVLSMKNNVNAGETVASNTERKEG